MRRRQRSKPNSHHLAYQNSYLGALGFFPNLTYVSRNTTWKAWKSQSTYMPLLLPQVCGAVNTTPYLEGMLYMGIWYEAVSQPASLSADKAGCPLSHDKRQVKLIRLSQWASRFEVIKGNDCKLSWQDWSNENLLGSCYQVAFKDD